MSLLLLFPGSATPAQPAGIVPLLEVSGSISTTTPSGG